MEKLKDKEIKKQIKQEEREKTNQNILKNEKTRRT